MFPTLFVFGGQNVAGLAIKVESDGPDGEVTVALWCGNNIAFLSSAGSSFMEEKIWDEGHGVMQCRRKNAYSRSEASWSIL